VPNWTVAAAIAAPVTLVATSSVATMLPASHDDPVGQTMSVLAATPRSAPVMTIGFVLTAVCQILTAAGVYVLRRTGDVGLVGDAARRRPGHRTRTAVTLSP
jgi:hypothetical protein